MQTHRDALVKALQAQNKMEAHEQAYELIEDSFNVAKRPVISSMRFLGRISSSALSSELTMGSLPSELFYGALLDAFQTRKDSGVFSADRVGSGERYHSNVALCIRGLLPLAAGRQKILDLAIFSLLAMYMGRLTGDTDMKELARSTYTSAIGDFRHFLASTLAKDLAGIYQRHSQVALLLCTTMALFEVSTHKLLYPTSFPKETSLTFFKSL